MSKWPSFGQRQGALLSDTLQALSFYLTATAFDILLSVTLCHHGNYEDDDVAMASFKTRLFNMPFLNVYGY